MKQRKIISKTVEQYDGDWPPNDPQGFIDWFQKRINDFPEESKSAIIELSTTSCGDSSYATITFTYDRLETDEEEAEREAAYALNVQRRKEQDLRTLAELKKKYEAKG
jgi:hypothetical protein